MSEMKLIMENWHGYLNEERVSLPESLDDWHNSSYITEILGVELPLNESGQAEINEELKDHILSEHLLYEGFIDSLLSGAKRSVGKVKDLFITLYKILKDANDLGSFILLLKKKVINPIAKQFNQAFDKIISNAPAKVADIANKLKQILKDKIDSFRDLGDGWKSAMVGTTIALLLTFVYEKSKNLIKDVTGGKSKDEFMEFIKEQFAKFFGEDLLKNISDKILDIKTYIGWIGPAVGGVDFIASALEPITKRVAPAAMDFSRLNR